jgi:basic amino acid/polyamine antiporter, APA family
VRAPSLPRHLGLYDVTLIVVGSVVGSGIFRTPAVVAQRLPVAGLVPAAWLAGGLVALCGAFVLGELGARLPKSGGPYQYLREAFHPMVGFAYGWAGLLASFSGGLAAAAVLFAGYFLSLTGLRIWPSIVAVAVLALLAIVNAFGVRAGNRVQGALTVLKIVALLTIVAAGIFAHPAAASTPGKQFAVTAWPGALGIAMIPILFSYNGAMVANFMAAETKDVARTLPLALILGMACVTILYVLVNASCIRVLGLGGLAHTPVPVSSVLFAWTGPVGSRVASLVIAIVTLGFISNRMLTVPRLYQAMAHDGLFFRHVAQTNARTHAPVVAIAVQGVVAMLVALLGNYDQILNYVVATFYAFNGLLALALFVLRARDSTPVPSRAFRVPGHPVSTAVYLLASWGVAIAACISDPRDGLVGFAIVLSAVPVYFLWARGGAIAGAAS